MTTQAKRPHRPRHLHRSRPGAGALRPLAAALLAIGTLALVACEREPSAPPMPSVQTPSGAAPVAPAAALPTAPDPSLPDAASAVGGTDPATAPGASQSSDAAAESNVTRKQEAVDMPLPGQANDHSTPGHQARDDAARKP
jgi:hypothetical protein